MSSTAAGTETPSAPTGQAGAGAGASSSTDASKAGSTPATGTTPETKPAASLMGGAGEPEKKVDEKKADGQDASGDKSKDGKSAETVTLEIKLPEGMKADEAALGEFKALATKHKLTSEQASEIVALQHKLNQTAEKAINEAWVGQGKKWADEINADKEFGGEKFKQTLDDAWRFIRKFGGEPDAKGVRPISKALDELGIGNHPELMKIMARAGRTLAEDRSDVKGGVKASSTPKTREERIDGFYNKSS